MKKNIVNTSYFCLRKENKGKLLFVYNSYYYKYEGYIEIVRIDGKMSNNYSILSSPLPNCSYPDRKCEEKYVLFSPQYIFLIFLIYLFFLPANNNSKGES